MTGPEPSHILEKYFSNICISEQFWLGTLETGNLPKCKPGVMWCCAWEYPCTKKVGRTFGTPQAGTVAILAQGTDWAVAVT